MVASDEIPKVVKRLSRTSHGQKSPVSRKDDVMQGGHVVAWRSVVARLSGRKRVRPLREQKIQHRKSVNNYRHKYQVWVFRMQKVLIRLSWWRMSGAHEKMCYRNPPKSRRWYYHEFRHEYRNPILWSGSMFLCFHVGNSTPNIIKKNPVEALTLATRILWYDQVLNQGRLAGRDVTWSCIHKAWNHIFNICSVHSIVSRIQQDR